MGSPTVRVDGRDVEPGAEDRRDVGWKSRVYHTPYGPELWPMDRWLHDALARAGA